MSTKKVKCYYHLDSDCEHSEKEVSKFATGYFICDTCKKLGKKDLIEEAKKSKQKTKNVKCYYDKDDNCSHCEKEVNGLSPSYFICDVCKDLGKVDLIKETNKKQAENRKKTMIEKYGVENISQSVDFKEKISEGMKNSTEQRLEATRKTNRERYGVDHTSQLEEIKKKISESKNSENMSIMIEKMKRTKLERYGDENYNNRESTNITNKNKYGGNSPMCSEEIRNKSKETNLENSGYEFPSQNPETRERISKINQERYGGNSTMCSKEVLNKREENSLLKYGVKNHMQTEEMKNKFREYHIKRAFPRILQNLEYLNLEFIDENYLGSHIIHNFKCKKCETIISQLWNSIQQGYQCPTCFPRNQGFSKQEREIGEELKTFGINVEYNRRDIISPYEVDILIEDKKICIEYCGLYWHNEIALIERGIKNPIKYHYQKMKMCNDKGYRLITIFEDEWLNKKDIVIDRLKNLFNLTDGKKIGARECTIKEISPKEKDDFLYRYHIQGTDMSQIRLGAFFNDELISVMTFGKGNFAKGIKNSSDVVWELNRFCSKSNYSVRGIAGKLLEHFKNNYEWKCIYSYADLRWSDGGLYKALGFISSNIKERLNYWYVGDRKRIHRFALRKKENEPKEIPERLLRLQEGYKRIWDCGNLRFDLYKI